MKSTRHVAYFLHLFIIMSLVTAGFDGPRSDAPSHSPSNTALYLPAILDGRDANLQALEQSGAPVDARLSSVAAPATQDNALFLPHITQKGFPQAQSDTTLDLSTDLTAAPTWTETVDTFVQAGVSASQVGPGLVRLSLDDSGTGTNIIEISCSGGPCAATEPPSSSIEEPEASITWEQVLQVLAERYIGIERTRHNEIVFYVNDGAEPEVSSSSVTNVHTGSTTNVVTMGCAGANCSLDLMLNGQQVAASGIVEPIPLPALDAYGNIRGGDQGHVNEIIYSFDGRAGDLELHYEAWDINSDNEVDIYLNGSLAGTAPKQAGTAQTSDIVNIAANYNWTGLHTVTLPDALVSDSGTNLVTFDNTRNPPKTHWWGIRNVQLASVPQPTATSTNTLLPTATSSNTPSPTATSTSTPPPTATSTNTSSPSATSTNTPLPTATSTSTPLPTPQLKVDSDEVSPGSELEISVEVLNLQPDILLSAANLVVGYNPAVVNPVHCLADPEGRFDLALCNIDTAGTVRFNVLNAAGVTQDPLRLVRVTFQAVGQSGQTSALDLQVSTFANVSGVAIPNNVQDGLVTISQPPPASPTPTPSGPTVGSITTNETIYPNNHVPRYAKLELTFDVETVAENLQLPYDPLPPPGVESNVGVTVDALFSPDNWQTVYKQPAFYYQEFLNKNKNGKDWFYPTDTYVWKARFAPNQAGTWQYKISVQDAGGAVESSTQTFTVADSDNRGFVRVSLTDPRYFEFEDGSYFPALGYNMNYNHVDWVNPVVTNEPNFQVMSQNGIQLVRIWLSQWAIYGSEWNPWMSQDPSQHGLYLPYNGIVADDAMAGSDFSMKIQSDYNPCMFIGSWKAKPAVQRNTDYHFRIRYKSTGIGGPRIAGHPYGFVAKTGGWLWGDGTYCQDPGVGTLLSVHQVEDTADWETLEGTINSGNNDFLPNFFLVLENVTSGTVYVDYVWIQEDLGNGNYGPNIVSKPWMAHHLYMEQRNSYAFDKVLELAEQYGIYIRPVIHEKNERIFTRIDFDGNTIMWDARCFDQDSNNDPERCPSNQWFFGDRRAMTKVRWLQQAWWRYLQARWGYSPSIHSWELLNEGNPASELHYTLADEFGKYMRQFAPNHHLVSTSFWHSFPKNNFWANSAYPNVDFADVHKYVDESSPTFTDTALETYEASMQYGANRPGGAGKPVIRGETGFTSSGSGPATTLFENDTDAVWLHNFIWGGINPGGLIESYWYETPHIYKKNVFDHRGHYGTYYHFIEDVPLNNGHYQDAQATVSDANLRAWGQKDLVHGCAHLWIQNKQHTWKNVVDGVSIPAIDASVVLSGFAPNTEYAVEWWDPYQTDKSQQVVRVETLASQADGNLSFAVNNLTTDTAVKVIATSGCGT